MNIDEYIPDIKDAIDEEFQKFFSSKNFKKELNIRRKDDGSFITDLDEIISLKTKNILKNDLEAEKFVYYSEEDYSDLSFPGIFLDPVDGTSQLCEGIGEVAISFCYLHSPEILDPKNFAWIYNPFTGLSLKSTSIFIPPPNTHKEKKFGLISRREYAWIYKNIDQHVLEDLFVSKSLAPRGSIAYKLGLLAAGACDFIFTYRNKKIWDIAAGSVLLAHRGIDLYSGDKKITHLDKNEFTGPLLWCRSDELTEYQDFYNLTKAK